MELIIYYWSDGYFQIDTQTGIGGWAIPPVIDGYSDYTREVK